jgi:hypothetical protein
MSPDDIDSIVLDLSDFMHNSMGIDFNDEEYDMLYNFMHNQIDPFVTRERNYN